MTGPYGPDLFPSTDPPINHDAPKPGAGFFRDELESMLSYHTTCAPCAFKTELLNVLKIMNRHGIDFARVVSQKEVGGSELPRDSISDVDDGAE
ncbi:hypothetical protein ACFXNW_17570 [Nocardia sp. NPDC059180]|uniref:hypothetical protein n=1 Tax=Nocardia sp. NPDC059180 TaxID=3346761 RepID=UPI0036A83C74